MDKSNKLHKFDKEAKKAYFKRANSNRKAINIRLRQEEVSLLQIQMKNEGWGNMSAYIRYKIFGADPEEKLDNVISKADKEDIEILLRNEVLRLVDQFEYFRQRYNKDMNQLWQEEGVDMKEWRTTTNRWHAEMTKEMQDVFIILRKIALALKLEGYFEKPSDKMQFNRDVHSQEQLDRLSEQMRKEDLAMGIFDVEDK